MEGGAGRWGPTGIRCHAVQEAHGVVEMSNENIKEKAIRSLFASYGSPLRQSKTLTPV